MFPSQPALCVLHWLCWLNFVCGICLDALILLLIAFISYSYGWVSLPLHAWCLSFLSIFLIFFFGNLSMLFIIVWFWYVCILMIDKPHFHAGTSACITFIYTGIKNQERLWCFTMQMINFVVVDLPVWERYSWHIMAAWQNQHSKNNLFLSLLHEY